MALACARPFRNVVVVAPAALRDAWRDASRQSGVRVSFVSVEALSHSGAPTLHPDFVIVDEAHHLRSGGTRRFAAASELCRSAKVLLLSATPVQNRVDDLGAILSLFLGERAHALSADELGHFIVRRVESDVPAAARLGLPSVRDPRWLHVDDDGDCLDRLVALPPPPADGEDGGILLTYTLVRQWASSRAALRAALWRRLARARALEDALRAGRLPSKAELLSWACENRTQQLAFPELTVRTMTNDAEGLREQVRRHADAVRGVLESLDRTADPDRLRADVLRNVIRGHPGERLIGFSEYSATISALYRALAPLDRVAMLSHAGGRVAGGPISRRELLARFAPGGGERTSESDRITLLLTTDVLSEGVNLQDASVVIHLDLAWNPARLEQRVGRLRRIGAARDCITVYLFSPPAPADQLLRLEHRLRLKAGVAARTVGIAGAILPAFGLPAHDAPASREQRITTALREWRRDHVIRPASPLVATVSATCNAALACVRGGPSVTLLAVTDDGVSDSTSDVERIIAACRGTDQPHDVAVADAMLRRVVQWVRRRDAASVVELSALRVARSRRALLQRVDAIGKRAARHARPGLAPLMHAARSAATATLSAGAERVLEELAAAPMSDDAWLHAIGEFASLHARAPSSVGREVVALLILRQTDQVVCANSGAPTPR